MPTQMFTQNVFIYDFIVYFFHLFSIMIQALNPREH